MTKIRYFRAFTQFIGDLREIQEKEYVEPSPVKSVASVDIKQFVGTYCFPDQHVSLVGKNKSDFGFSEFPEMVLDDLDLVGTLGIGGFGRVELVQYSKEKGRTFALKCLKKKHIVDTQQQVHYCSLAKSFFFFYAFSKHSYTIVLPALPVLRHRQSFFFRINFAKHGTV